MSGPTAGASRRGPVAALGPNLLTAFRAAAPALLGYLAVRAVGLLVLALWARAEDQPVVGLLADRSDSVWYLDIARNGYRADGSSRSLAFFPLHPYLVRYVDLLLPGGLEPTAVALAIVYGLAAAWGIFAVGEHLYDRRTGVLLAMLWGALPHAIVQSMAYTEAAFTALVAWSLLALLKGRWVTAGALCLVAGLVRPTALALIAAVGLACLVALVRRQGGWRPLLAMVLAPLGYVGYVGWVGLQEGRADAYFVIQRDGWNQSFDGGAFTLRTAWTSLAEARVLDHLVVTLVLAMAVTLLVFCVLERQPFPFLVYSAVMLAGAISTDQYFNSKARLLVPAFTLLIPVAAGLGRSRPSTRWAVLVWVTLFSAWFGGYLLLVWEYSP